jgi:flagellar basal body rod protein FlgG
MDEKPKTSNMAMIIIGLIIILLLITQLGLSVFTIQQQSNRNTAYQAALQKVIDKYTLDNKNLMDSYQKTAYNNSQVDTIQKQQLVAPETLIASNVSLSNQLSDLMAVTPLK